MFTYSHYYKHICRPITARVVSDIFYKSLLAITTEYFFKKTERYCTITNSHHTLCKIFGPIIIARFWEVILFPGIWRKIKRRIIIIVCQTPWAGKMNRMSRDWLPKRARWSYLSRSGLPAVSRKKNFAESHIINPLLTKLVRSRWLDIGLVLFLRIHLDLDTQKRTWPISSHLDLTLPDFKPWRSRYESVNYGISNYWFP